MLVVDAKFEYVLGFMIEGKIVECKKHEYLAK